MGGRAGPSSLPIHPEEVMAGPRVREGTILVPVSGCPLGVRAPGSSGPRWGM